LLHRITSIKTPLIYNTLLKIRQQRLLTYFTIPQWHEEKKKLDEPFIRNKIFKILYVMWNWDLQEGWDTEILNSQRQDYEEPEAML